MGEGTACRTPCPKFTDFHPGEYSKWSISAVTRGHFLSPGSDDAAIAILGCEPHSENFGGTILLTRRHDKWTMLWYKAGVDTSQCHKTLLPSQREILVCVGEAEGQGNIETSIYVEDLRSPTKVWMASNEPVLFTIFDNVGTCGEFGQEPVVVTHAVLENLEFTSHNGRKTLVVVAQYGKRPMNSADVAACIKDGDSDHYWQGLAVPMKTYRIDFLFDGRTFKLSPSSARAAQIFKER